MARTGANPVLAGLMTSIGLEIQKLSSPDSFHQKIADECFADYRDVLHERWAVVDDTYSSLSMPFVCAVIFWLTIVFAGFGLGAPWNPTVGIVLLLGAVSVTSALVLILDVSMPYEGYFRIPSTAMTAALAQMAAP